MQDPFRGLVVGDSLDPLDLTISQAANERYWAAAGIDHPLLRDGALYPLIAANLVVLSVTHHLPEALIQTRQRLECHRRAQAPATLHTVARVIDRYERRDLPYIAVRAAVFVDDELLWEAESHFTPAQAVTSR